MVAVGHSRSACFVDVRDAVLFCIVFYTGSEVWFVYFDQPFALRRLPLRCSHDVLCSTWSTRVEMSMIFTRLLLVRSTLATVPRACRGWNMKARRRTSQNCGAVKVSIVLVNAAGSATNVTMEGVKLSVYGSCYLLKRFA